MALVHYTGGQTGRGKETGSTKFRNSMTPERNWFFYRGELFSWTGYHKARSATDLNHRPARFLPPQVTNLVLIYLAYIRPFANMLYSNISGTRNPTDGDYLFCDFSQPRQSWTGKELARALERTSTKYLGEAFNIQKYRANLARSSVRESFCASIRWSRWSRWSSNSFGIPRFSANGIL